METTTVQLFNDSLNTLDGTQIIAVNDYHKLNRRELIEIMHNNNVANYNQGYDNGYTHGLTVGFLYAIFVVLGWVLLKSYFNHNYENKHAEKTEVK